MGLGGCKPLGILLVPSWGLLLPTALETPGDPGLFNPGHSSWEMSGFTSRCWAPHAWCGEICWVLGDLQGITPAPSAGLALSACTFLVQKGMLSLRGGRVGA